MIPAHLTSALAMAADRAINSALRSGATAVGQKMPTGEVGFVAAFVLGAVPMIASAWKPILKPAGYSLSLMGVFTHQTPRASFVDSVGVPCQCELADLLVVVDDLTSGAQGQRWATLIQAKMAKPSGGQSLTTQRDLTQLDLLLNWPNFSLPSGFAPGLRDFGTCTHPGITRDCGRYGLIDQQPNPAWHQQAPAPVMPAAGDQLGTFLAKMMEQGQTGYGREATGLVDDWSRTVDELMRVSAGLGFTYAAGLKGLHPRGNTAVAFFVDTGDFRGPQGWWSNEPPPTGGHADEPSDFPSEGINLLRIGVARSESRSDG